MSLRTKAVARGKNKNKDKVGNPSDNTLSPADKEFALVIRHSIREQQRFSEFQRNRDKITLGNRERLLLNVLRQRESRGTRGIPVTELTAEYHAQSLNRMRAGESTISSMVTALEKQGFVEKLRTGKAVNVVLAPGGWEYFNQEETLITERLEIYKAACPDPEQRAIIKKFLTDVMAEFSRRIDDWRRGL